MAKRELPFPVGSVVRFKSDKTTKAAIVKIEFEEGEGL